MPTLIERDDSDEVVTDMYIAQRAFTYKGKKVKRGDPIPVAMLDHLRFDSYIGSGLIKGVFQ